MNPTEELDASAEVAVTCCTEEQLVALAAQSLRPFQSAWVRRHMDSCELCQARYAVYESLQQTAPLWRRIGQRAVELCEAIELALVDGGMQILRGIDGLAAAPTLKATTQPQPRIVRGQRTLHLDEHLDVDLQIAKLKTDKVLVRVEVLDPVRVALTLADESGVRHARYVLSQAVEFELSAGSWRLELERGTDSAMWHIPLTLSSVSAQSAK